MIYIYIYLYIHILHLYIVCIHNLIHVHTLYMFICIHINDVELCLSSYFHWPGYHITSYYLSFDIHNVIHIKLVGGFKHVLFSIIYGIILPID